VNHYELLDVADDAPTEVIRRAYLAKARRAHPDFHVTADGDTKAAAERQMRQLNEAWAVLGDPGRRRDYDGDLRARLRKVAGDRPAGTPSPGFVPYVDDDTDYSALLDEAGPGNGATVPRAAQLAPVVLLAVAVFSLCAGLVASFAPLLAVGAISFVLSALAFVLTPALAVMRSLESDRD
jgi:hypothetical protein